MPRGQVFVRQSRSASDVTIPTTTETVARTLGGVSSDRDENIRLWFWVQLTLGTNTTSVTLRLRRGTSASGTLIAEANAIAVPSAAGTVAEFWMCADDTGIEQAGASYSGTVEQAGATADGTVLQSAVYATVSP